MATISAPALPSRTHIRVSRAQRQLPRLVDEPYEGGSDMKHSTDVGDVVEVELSNGSTVLVDASDLPLIEGYRWHEIRPGGNTSYAWAGTGPKGDRRSQFSYMHRLLMGYPEADVDHINGNGLDNRRSNLRAATRSQNIVNRPGYGKSRHRGVTWHGQNRSWRVRGYKDRVKYDLGLFKDEDEAGRAYDAWVVEHYGEFARLNFPDEKGKYLER